MTDDSRGHMPEGRWAFDAEVTACFEDMLRRSIPQYTYMREAVASTARSFMRRCPLVVDLGCSWGHTISDVIAADPEAQCVGYEVSDPMVRVAQERFQGNPRVKIHWCDLTKWTVEKQNRGHADVVTSVLTLQFIPINYRQRIIEEAYSYLVQGGALIVVEKVLGQSAAVDEMMVRCYHDLKHANGYTRDAIEAKQRSLEGVLVPVTADFNVQLLHQAGFRAVDCFWRWMNFAGWVAVK